MRLQEIYNLVQNALKIWEDPNIETDNGIGFHMYNYQKIRTQIEPLRVFPLIQEDVDCVFSYPPDFSYQDVSAITGAIGRIHNYLVEINETLNLIDIQDSTLGFDVKLPSQISLEGLSSCSKDLNTIISQCPTLRGCEANVEFHGVDVGSAWLTFIVAGSAALLFLHNLAALIDKAIIIRSHYLTCKQQEESLKNSGVSADLLEKLVDTQKKILAQLQEDAVAELAKEPGITDPEDKNRISYSLDLIKGLIEQGLEIHAAIGSPEEVKAVFEPIEFKFLPGAETKLLDANSAKSDT